MISTKFQIMIILLLWSVLFFKVLYTHEKRRIQPQPFAQNVLQHGLLAFIALHLLLRGNP